MFASYTCRQDSGHAGGHDCISHFYPLLPLEFLQLRSSPQEIFRLAPVELFPSWDFYNLFFRLNTYICEPTISSLILACSIYVFLLLILIVSLSQNNIFYFWDMSPISLYCHNKGCMIDWSDVSGFVVPSELVKIFSLVLKPIKSSVSWWDAGSWTQLSVLLVVVVVVAQWTVEQACSWRANLAVFLLLLMRGENSCGVVWCMTQVLFRRCAGRYIWSTFTLSHTLCITS